MKPHVIIEHCRHLSITWILFGYIQIHLGMFNWKFDVVEVGSELRTTQLEHKASNRANFLALIILTEAETFLTHSHFLENPSRSFTVVAIVRTFCYLPFPRS